MARRVNTETAVNGNEELQFESVTWASGSTREPHPQLVAMIQQSWDNRVVNGNRIETPAYKLVCKTQEEMAQRVRQLREAGDYLKIGVGVRQYANPDTGQHEIHFRARKRRGTSPNGETTVSE